MLKYKLFVKIKSEAFFNSAESNGNMINLKALTDENGFVYFHGKTLKGQLKDTGFWIYEKYKSVDEKKAEKFLKILLYLFGTSSQELKERGYMNFFINNLEGAMKVSSLELDDETQKFFESWFQSDRQKKYITLTKDELIKAQTNDRIQIKIKDGIVEDGKLMTYQTVKEGLEFEATLEIGCMSDFTESDIYEVLERVVKGYRKIGASVSRGRGNIETSLVKQ